MFEAGPGSGFKNFGTRAVSNSENMTPTSATTFGVQEKWPRIRIRLPARFYVFCEKLEPVRSYFLFLVVAEVCMHFINVIVLN